MVDLRAGDEMTGVSLAGTQLRANLYARQIYDNRWNDIEVIILNIFRFVVLHVTPSPLIATKKRSPSQTVLNRLISSFKLPPKTISRHSFHLVHCKHYLFLNIALNFFCFSILLNSRILHTSTDRAIPNIVFAKHGVVLFVSGAHDQRSSRT